MGAEPDDQSEAIAFLSQAASYGETGPVERIDTHGAIVFLVGELAFKLKRAVRYPYLDFSTAERRRAVCEAELALNRRTAPALYLEVRAINRQADERLGFAPGAPVDWLVVMRRFGREGLLTEVAERGHLTEPLCRRLADGIAAFHTALAPVVSGDGAARLADVIDGNARSMAAVPAGALPGADCERLHALSRAALARIAPLLDARSRAGFVRHGHGDLHLRNICLWEGAPLPFDCLEFDPALATTDLLYDIAFLLMDLIERGYRQQASWVFNRYADRTGETAGLAALPLFLSVRAAVRAHVEALREEGRAAGRAYLDAALAFLDQPAPRLIAIGGISGTGKSTLARTLAPEIGGAPGARLLRTDVLRKRLAGLAPEDHLPDSAYTPQAHAAVYAQLLEEVRVTLQAGRSVVTDAVFDFPETRAQIGAVAARCGVPFTGLWLEAPRAVLHERVQGRHDDASDAGVGVVDRQLAREIGTLAPWLRVDAGGAPAQTLARARTLLDAETVA